ncbi:unnamed protein product [Candidula unifasciata]|uniref:Sulfatase N-terminal domain-containing protein n=1 Tax=Candidula unifasciata TaxID=100452 RepID=A0A8S3YTG9_9EUPU|nr:unnamed protein product [Candidula unifasciata]
MASLRQVSFLECIFMLTACPFVSCKPNIVFIVADDLGWNDVGFNNPDIISPNIDGLAKSGIILNQTYVQPLCSPSRSALMTGMYPFRLGLQHVVILAYQNVCMPLNLTTLPEVLKKEGYATHIVGKWHLGMCRWECTPTYRGFDSFYGYYNAEEDYYTKDVGGGYDFRDNKRVATEANGTYSTDLYVERFKTIIANHKQDTPLFLYLPFQNVHAPLEVPDKYYNMYPNIRDHDRRTFSGMVTALDDAVGEVVSALQQKGLYDNTLIVFTADNGGWVTFGGNNYPLRGGKVTVFEGGTRAVAFVHGPMFQKTGVRYDGLSHIVDWFPTLVEAAGSSYKDPTQDGVSQWKSLLSLSLPSGRDEVVYNLDYSEFPEQGKAAIRVGDYKLIAGYPGLYPDWYKPAQAHMSSVTRVDNAVSNKGTRVARTPGEQVTSAAPKNFYLFNLKDDPTEHNNIYDSHPDIVSNLTARLQAHMSRYVPPNYPPPDPASDPAKWGGAWSPGWC